jgi:hypothetical protein
LVGSRWENIDRFQFDLARKVQNVFSLLYLNNLPRARFLFWPAPADGFCGRKKGKNFPFANESAFLDKNWIKIG